VGDLITFKDLPPVPLDAQGKDFEVISVAAYQYSDGIVPEYTIKSGDDLALQLSLDTEDGERLCLSRTITRKQVLTLFDEATFAELWSDDYIDLEVVRDLPALRSWYAPHYTQSIIEGIAYYYARDMRTLLPSAYEDDGIELHYHECESDDACFGLSVEVYEDGDTDVSLQVYLPMRMIAHLWPGSA